MQHRRLQERFRQELLERSVSLDEDSLAFAVDFTCLAVRALSLVEPKDSERETLAAAVRARTELDVASAARLIGLALLPEFRAAVTAHELRAFAARFGEDSADAVRRESDEELDLAGYSVRYGSSEALLLLDTMFAVAGADGKIEDPEVGRLKRAAADLGIDEVLVTAFLQKYDPRQGAERVVPLTGDRVVIGRAPSCEVTLVDPMVALRHAELVRTGGQWRVVDLGSGRPTVVNGLAVHSAPVGEDSRMRLGPYTLRVVGGDLHIDGTRSFSALSVRRLSRRIGDIQLLDDVSFTVFTGEVVALVGPSGAGKTTLLNAIAGVAPPDEGEVLLDGQDFHKLLDVDRSLVGVVPQDDLVNAELTVDESLFYSGRLRFAPDVTDSEVHAEVKRVLGELDIQHIHGSRIGDVLRRGISGGQRKRVNLGQELITRSTRVLFLDEPTSGLDPRASQDIVRLVRQLADHGRIVFLVTHDLTPEVMVQVDHLLVLAQGGRLAWFGPPEDACRYFRVSTPDAVFNRFGDRPPEQWGRLFRESADFRKYVRTREHLLGLKGLGRPDKTARRAVRRSGFGQFVTLTRRYWRVKLRDRTGMAVLAVQPPLLVGVMALVFPGATSPMLFMLALSALWFGLSAAVRELISDRVIWLRERRVGVGVLPYLGSKVAVLGVLVAVQAVLLALMLYLSLDLASCGFDVVKLCGISVLTGWVGMTLGLLVSASWTSSEAAVGTLPLLLIPQITLSSIMVSVRDMNPAAKALTWLTVQRYTFDAVIKCGEQVLVPSKIPGELLPQPNLGQLYVMGLKLSANADDRGLSLGQLAAILVLHSVVFVLVTTGLVWARGRRQT